MTDFDKAIELFNKAAEFMEIANKAIEQANRHCKKANDLLDRKPELKVVKNEIGEALAKEVSDK